MKDEECVNGANVICTMFGSEFDGAVGYIYDVQRHYHNDKVRSYRVKKRSGIPISNGYFSFLESWELCGAFSPETLKSASIKTLSHECPCGIARIVCDYHK